MKRIFFYIFLLLTLVQCKQEEVVVPNNSVAKYNEIPTIKIENYINRMYIDLLGREPLDVEMQRDLAILKSNNLNFATRDSLIKRLQTDTSYVVGDSSYARAWSQRIYDLLKARFLEGASDDLIREKLGPNYFGLEVARLSGDSIGVFRTLETISRYEKLLQSRRDYQLGLISINEMCWRMIDNGIYDIINMNSFNFVNASFDDLFYRFPSQAEFENAYKIIESNETAIIFNRSASNKSEYCNVLVSSKEFYEGMIRWCFLSLMNREATSQEIYNRFASFYQNADLKALQRTIIRTDEYARF